MKGEVLLLKKLSSVKKKLLIAFSFIVIVFAIISVLITAFGKSDEDKILDSLNNYAEAFNTGDFDGMMECFSSELRRKAQAMTNIGEGIGSSILGVSGIGVNDIFAFNSEEMGTTMKIEVNSINITGKNEAAVDLTMHLTERYLFEHTEQGDMTIYFVKEKGKWLIDSDSLM